MKLYILCGQEPVPCDDLIEWARWFEASIHVRAVAKTTVGDARVSTVFLGLDHRFDAGPPLLFETLVFDGPLDGEMDRYSTWAEAQCGHDAMVARVTRRQRPAMPDAEREAAKEKP